MIGRRPNKALRHRRERTSMTSLLSPEPACWPPALAGLPRLLASRACWPPALAGLPRLLAHAAPLSFALLAMTFCAAPAHAGHWQFSAAGSTDTSTVHVEGVLQPPPTPWAPPSAPSDNSLTLQLPGATASDTNLSQPPSCDCTATASVKITANWVTDTTSDNTPPTSVWLCENSSASWAAGPGYGVRNVIPIQFGQPPPPPPPPPPPTVYGGSASNASSDAYVPVPATGIPTSGSSTLSATQTAPPDGWHQYPVSGGQVTLPTRTVTATASVTEGTVGKVSLSCGLAYSITVHAQPYNFRSASFTDTSGVLHPAVVIDNPNATLSLSYLWSSTDGKNSDLTTCTFNENVTWDTNTTGTVYPTQKVYAPPSPPAGTDAQGHPIGYLDPTVMGGPATNGAATDTFSPDSAYKGPYATISWWGDQTYVFSDSATGEVNTPMPGPAAGSFRITRAFAPTGTPSGTTGTLTISTRGNSAGPKILQ